MGYVLDGCGRVHLNFDLWPYCLHHGYYAGLCCFQSFALSNPRQRAHIRSTRDNSHTHTHTLQQSKIGILPNESADVSTFWSSLASVTARPVTKRGITINSHRL